MHVLFLKVSTATLKVNVRSLYRAKVTFNQTLLFLDRCRKRETSRALSVESNMHAGATPMRRSFMGTRH